MKPYTPIRQFYAHIGFLAIIAGVLTPFLVHFGYNEKLAYFWDIGDSLVQIAILAVLIRIACNPSINIINSK